MNPNLPNQCPIWEYLYRFQFFTLTNNSAINTFVLCFFPFSITIKMKEEHFWKIMRLTHHSWKKVWQLLTASCSSSCWQHDFGMLMESSGPEVLSNVSSSSISFSSFTNTGGSTPYLKINYEVSSIKWSLRQVLTCISQ